MARLASGEVLPVISEKPWHGIKYRIANRHCLTADIGSSIRVRQCFREEKHVKALPERVARVPRPYLESGAPRG